MRQLSAFLIAVLWIAVENAWGYMGGQCVGRVVRPYYHSSPSVGGSFLLGHSQLMQAATLYKPPKYLMEVARSVGDNRLLVSDVSFKSGKDFSTVNKDLMGLVTATGANILVTDKGDIMYEMPPNYERRILQQSISQRIQLLCDTAYQPVMKVVKGGFAVILFTSLVVMTTAIIAVASAASSSRNDERDGDGSGSKGGSNSNRKNQRHEYRYQSRGPQIHAVIDIGEAIRFLTAKPQLTSAENPQGSGMSFLDSFHSYVFGDKDPNKDYATQLSIQAARTIRRGEGVVIAEQLIPCLPKPPVFPKELLRQGSLHMVSKTATVHESYVLPIVHAFKGEPQVTANGNIAYQFKEFMITAHEDSLLPESIQQTSRTPPEEQEVTFSAASAGQRFLAAALGVANLLVARVLGAALKAQNVQVARTAPSLLRALSKAYPLLLCYAVLYNVIPLGRFLFNLRRNATIRSRNKERALWASFCENSDAMQIKLQDAKKHCKKDTREAIGSYYIGDDPILFTSTPASSP